MCKVQIASPFEVKLPGHQELDASAPCYRSSVALLPHSLIVHCLQELLHHLHTAHAKLQYKVTSPLNPDAFLLVVHWHHLQELLQHLHTTHCKLQCRVATPLML